VRMTYDATIRVPRGMLALMSAENPQQTNDTGIYTFAMKDPIPSYLVALAVGRLEFRPLSDRSGVYAEPELIDAAEEELGYIPAMVEAGQRIAGPYRWGRYDVLLMPPTYVVGGMEHPRLNFIAPFSVATGNHPKQLYPTTLIAHELSHSWSGDLATVANWNDVWLNEGITSYLTLRIIEEVAARDRADYSFFNDRATYADYVSNLKDQSFTRLHRDVTNSDFAAGVFNTSAYTKGELFMKTLEDLVGRATLDAFLRDYFATFSFRWVDDKAFLSFFRARVVRGNAQLESRLQLDDWVYGTGLPANITAPTSSSIYNAVAIEAAAFRAGKAASALPRDWEPFEFDLFFALAFSSAGSRMAELDSVFHFSDMASPPTSWLNLTVDANYLAGRPALERILRRGGGNGLVQSLYSRLARTAAGKQYALSIYATARDRYAPFVRSFVDQVLGWAGATSMKRAA
ncbi:MAG TPA: leukotriene A4 hydrolase C-terminal domain-containing protein, partial [Thermoanaerobaculia bacterium]|nr:leukotriene A4 hydrolase C-terminal domain-containing protein [Thermoanaerobaculia bacterium]